MLKIAAVIALVAVAAVALVLVVAMTRPDTFRVQRAETIQAPPETIYALIEDFRRWGVWSPYEALDSAMKRSYGGADKGVGATYAWESGGKAGVGRMAITEAAAPNRVAIALDFTKPFEAHNRAAFTLEPQGDATRVSTRVTWAMEGECPLIAKVMGLVFDMDKMIGGDFETGLGNLKAAAEK